MIDACLLRGRALLDVKPASATPFPLNSNTQKGSVKYCLFNPVVDTRPGKKLVRVASFSGRIQDESRADDLSIMIRRISVTTMVSQLKVFEVFIWQHLEFKRVFCIYRTSTEYLIVVVLLIEDLSVFRREMKAVKN